MTTIYVYDNDKVTHDGQGFENALVEEHECESFEEGLDWATEKYGTNDFTFSSFGPTND